MSNESEILAAERARIRAITAHPAAASAPGLAATLIDTGQSEAACAAVLDAFAADLAKMRADATTANTEATASFGGALGMPQSTEGDRAAAADGWAKAAKTANARFGSAGIH